MINPKIVVIGGGTGSFTVLSGLKSYAKNITAIVSMSDDGGSSGVLIDEYGVLPPGDVRQCLVALSNTPKVRELFNYRFDTGSFDGHCFGNLFLSTLEKLTGSFEQAVNLAGDFLKTTGAVVPVTLESATLCMKSGNKTTKHERNIDEKKFEAAKPELWIEPKVKLNPAVKKAVMAADMVVIAPGSLYTSLGAILVVSGMGKILRETKAKKVYFCNLVNKPGQTDDFLVEDFAAELERLAGGKFLDLVFYNNHLPDKKLLEKYASEGELLVKYGGSTDPKYRGINLLSQVVATKNKGDRLNRSLIRHDNAKVAQEIMRLLF